MTTISDRYANELRNASELHVISAAEVWRGDELLLPLNIEASSTLTVSRSAPSRRTATVVLTDPNAGTPDAMVPSTADAALTPYGNELVLYSGIQYSDGTQELIQLCVCGMTDVVIDASSGDLVITLTAKDRAAAISRAGFIDNYPIAPSTNVGEAIQALLLSGPTGLTLAFDFEETDAITPLVPLIYKPGDDRWAMATDLAGSAGKALYFKPNGDAAFKTVPDPNSAPTNWLYEQGPGNLASEVTRTISRVNADNYFIRTGQGTGQVAPVQGVALDDNPLSPTYIGGRYGLQGPNTKSSPLYTTEAMATAAAVADLRVALGTVEGIDLKAVPKPDHEVDHVISMVKTRAGLLVPTRYVFDDFSLGFQSAGVLEAVGRQVAA